MKDLRFIHNSDIKPPLYIEDLKVIEEFHAKGNKFNEKFKKYRENETECRTYLAKDSTNKWKEFKEDFLQLTGGRCVICEQNINNYDDIEHYRPKNHYWWLAYDYLNYAIYCKLCNSTYKKDFFPLLNENEKVNFEKKDKIENEKPLLVNPLTDNPLDFFEIEIVSTKTGRGEVKLFPKKNLKNNSWEYQKSENSIKFYNLNNSEKNDISRQNRMQNLFYDLSDLAESFEEFIKDTNNKINEDKFYKKIKNLRINKKLGITEFIPKKQYKLINI